MKLIYVVLFTWISHVALLMCLRLLTIFTIAEDYELSHFITTLTYGFMYDICFSLIAFYPLLLFVASLLALNVEFKQWQSYVAVFYGLLLSLCMSALAAGSYVTWHVLEQPLHIDVFSMTQKQGPGRMVTDALLLFGLDFIVYVLLMAVFIYVNIYALRKLLPVFDKWSQWKTRLSDVRAMHYVQAVLLLLIPFLLMKPLVRYGFKDEMYDPVVGHTQLLDMIYDPWHQVYFTYLNKKRGFDIEFVEYLNNGSLVDCVRQLYPGQNIDNLDDLFSRSPHNPGVLKQKPKHVFLILVESYSSWALNGEYGAKDLCTGFNALKQKGHSWQYVLQASLNTSATLLSMVNGMPYTGDKPAYYSGMGTSIVPVFKQLGYNTQYYSASYDDWGHVNLAIDGNGFDIIRSFADDYEGEQSNDWGLYDHEFYDYFLKEFDDSDPSFSVLLTTSNHMPFNIPVEEHGYDYEKVRYCENYASGVVAKDRISHMWYADKSMEAFVLQLSKKYPDSLIVITGDHVSRNPPVKVLPEIYKVSVPLLFYGPEILNDQGLEHSNIVSHLDVLPTVIEMIAPNGFEYKSIGRNLYNLKHDPLVIGYGNHFSDGAHLYEWQRGNVGKLIWPKDGPQAALSLLDEYRCKMALFWYRTSRGRILSDIKY